MAIVLAFLGFGVALGGMSILIFSSPDFRRRIFPLPVSRAGRIVYGSWAVALLLGSSLLAVLKWRGTPIEIHGVPVIIAYGVATSFYVCLRALYLWRIQRSGNGPPDSEVPVGDRLPG